LGVNWDEAHLRSELEQAMRQGEKASQASARLASLSGWPRRRVYQMATEIAKTFQGK
jgi:hypothetical protein